MALRSGAPFIKSSASAQGGNCVQVRSDGNGHVVVRDSKNPDGERLAFTPDEWSAFITGAKSGEFDII